MVEYTPDIERLTSEELLSVVLAMVAPTEADPMHERGLRFDAQRAATELFCRAASAQRPERADAVTEAVGSMRHLRGV